MTTIVTAGYHSAPAAKFDCFLTAIESDLQGDPDCAMSSLRALTEELENIRRQAPHEWKGYCERLRRHSLHRILLQDPYTNRAFLKPRGFAGDAAMLDYVYGKCDSDGVPAGIAGRVLAYTAGLALPARAVRERRSKATEFIERSVSVSTGREVDVLCFAAGHLREVGYLNEHISRCG